MEEWTSSPTDTQIQQQVYIADLSEVYIHPIDTSVDQAEKAQGNTGLKFKNCVYIPPKIVNTIVFPSSAVGCYLFNP